ncbi:MAG: D-tyrosyl-tRNA(Tyr) deacylase [Bacteroidales bacterium]|nr:D-tyrosyl-tRNA(Tyr) deacylase [Bacteroidales bacterium]
MIALIQRASRAEVRSDGRLLGSISAGLMILLGVIEGDTMQDVNKLVKKCSMMRIFADDNGVMNRSVIDIGGQVMVVSQFTLAADIRKGNRPSYIKAARPEQAIPLYETFCRLMSEAIGHPVATGEFGADMQVELINDGPVTIIADSRGL